MKTESIKKVTVFIGSQRKKATYEAVQEFEKNLESYADFDFEYVFLSDYHLENCKGCCLCFNKGEEHCPLKDDRDLLLDKINNSDGVIFATPNYAFQVTALMKNFLDRLSFIFHRPRFFGKALTVIVAQGKFGGASIVKYLGFIGQGLGFDVTKGCYLTSLETQTELEKKRITQKIKKASARFYKQLTHPTPMPSFLKLMAFRVARTGITKTLDEKDYDYRYYKEKGWFKSDYYYPASMGIAKKLAGHLFDFLAAILIKFQRG
jgi:Multimeric flavodoxin WrbA